MYGQTISALMERKPELRGERRRREREKQWESVSSVLGSLGILLGLVMELCYIQRVTRRTPTAWNLPQLFKRECKYSLFCLASQVVWLFVTPWSSTMGPLSMRILGNNTGGLPFSFSRGLFWPRERTGISWLQGRFFTLQATREAQCVSSLLLCNVL